MQKRGRYHPPFCRYPIADWGYPEPGILTNLVNGFFRTSLFIFQQILHGSVSLRMSVLYISLVLKENEIAILGGVIHLLNFFKRKILFGICITVIGSCDSTITVPINISFGSLRINVFAVFQIKPTVIMLWIVSAIFTGTTIVSCQPQRLFLHFFLSVAKENEAALLLSCFIYAQVIPSIKWRNATDWARLPPLTCTGILHSLYPCTKSCALCAPAGQPVLNHWPVGSHIFSVF